MLGEKRVSFDVAQTRCMLLYVDTYSGVKCGGIHESHSKRAYRAPPERTVILHTVILKHYCTAEYFRCVVLSASCNEFRFMAPSIAAVSCFAISYFVDQFQLLFFHLLPCFSMKAEPQFLTFILLNSGPVMEMLAHNQYESMFSSTALVSYISYMCRFARNVGMCMRRNCVPRIRCRLDEQLTLSCGSLRIVMAS